MKRRWKILIGVGIFALLVSMSLTITMRVQPAREVDAYKKFLRAHGEKLELSEVVPKVAPEDNSVDAVQDAFRLLDPDDGTVLQIMEMVAPGKALCAWQQPDVRGWDFTNSWPEFSVTVAARRPATEQLRHVLDRPFLFFPFPSDIKSLSSPSVQPFLSMRGAVRQLGAAAILDLHNGSYGAAITNILVSLAIVERNATEGLELDHMVRLATLSTTTGPTWEALQTTNITDAQLAGLQNGWERLNLLKDAENAMVGERAWDLAEVARSRQSHQGFVDTITPLLSFGASGGSGGSWRDTVDDLVKGSRLAVGEALWRSSWSYSDELHTLKSYQVIIDALRKMETDTNQFYRADYDAMISRLGMLGLTNYNNPLYKVIGFPDLEEAFGGGWKLPGTMIRTETARRIVITAIALKRFQLKHGAVPQNLDELVPEFLVSVPIDPFDGKPLKYHPNADKTFRLYGVGEDGIDDGGNPTNTAGDGFSWQSNHARDWVWPQPAREAEIQYFREHPPK